MKKNKLNKEYVYDIIKEFPYSRNILISLPNINIKKIKKNIKRMKKEIVNYLIDKYGLSKKTASKITEEAFKISRMVSKKLTDKNELIAYAEEQFEKEIEVILSTPYKRDHLIKRKTFFLPSKDGKKHYYVKFVSDKQAALNDEKFNEMALALLKNAVEKNLDSKFDLLHSFFKMTQVDELISYVAGTLYSDIEIESFETLTNDYEDNYFFIKDHISSENKFDIAGLFCIQKGADEDKARKASREIVKHIVNNNISYIKEKDLSDYVIKFQKNIAEKKAKKDKSISKGNDKMLSKIVSNLYNDFLDNCVLYRQFIEVEKKKVKIEDYLKDNQISLVKFIRI